MTNTEDTTEVVLKTDTVGRVMTPAARRQSLLEEFEKSGLSGTKFAALAGIKYSTFANWRQRRSKSGGRGRGEVPADTAKQMRWLEAVIEQAQSPAGKASCTLVLELPGGARTQIATASQAALAAALLRALGSPCGRPPC